MRTLVAVLVMLAVGATNALAGVADTHPCWQVGSPDWQWQDDCGVGMSVKD